MRATLRALALFACGGALAVPLVAATGPVARSIVPPEPYKADADPGLAGRLRDQLRAERRTSDRLRRELARSRARGATGFSEADTRTAARLVATVIGWPEAGALRVAWCESHHQPWARNSTALSNGDHATGSWQVAYPGTWLSTLVGRAFPAEASARNPYVNAFAAAEVWRRHRGSFTEWNDVCARQGGG